jgi:endonuclease/exonuclease/phosphatase family metal-dependent hydrolase
MRLMSWNLRSLRDNPDAVIRVIRTLRPDVLFVQEAPRFLRAQSKLAALARESSLVVAAGGKPAAGVAILVDLRVEVADARSLLLSKQYGLHQRGVAKATLTLLDRRWVAASIHLGLDDQERRKHAAEILQHLSGHEAPVALGGDFNEPANEPARQLLMRGRWDPGAAADEPTFSARNPRRRIDAIVVPDHWEAQSVSPLEIVDESDLLVATDHLPVIVDVMG